MPGTAAPRLTVVVPTYQRPHMLDQCLASLRSQDAPAGSFEVVVVDDASGPETVAVLQRATETMPLLRWVSQPVNRGPAAARNRAVAMAAGPLLMFVDDDVVASPSLVSTHLRLHEGAPDTFGVVGLIEWLPSLTVTPFMRWLDSVPLQFGFASMTAGPLADPTGAFYTCNLSMSAALFNSVGGFDERFPFPAYEDTELAIRLLSRGFELHYRPEALGWHSRAITLEEFSERMGKVAQSALVFQEAYPESTALIANLTTMRHSALTRAILRLVSPVVPKLFGHDLRATYYWERVRAGYSKGLSEKASAAARPQ